MVGLTLFALTCGFAIGQNTPKSIQNIHVRIAQDPKSGEWVETVRCSLIGKPGAKVAGEYALTSDATRSVWGKKLNDFGGDPVHNPEDRGKPVGVIYTREAHVKGSGSKISFRPFDDFPRWDKGFKDGDTTDLLLAEMVTLIATLEAPDGYAWKKVPYKYMSKNDSLGLEDLWEAKTVGNTLQVTFRVWFRKRPIAEEDFNEVAKFFRMAYSRRIGFGYTYVLKRAN